MGTQLPIDEVKEACVTHDGVTTRFRISNPSDVIQSKHLRGHFYEINQLIYHKNLIYFGSCVLDVGANIGNHTIFYATHTSAAAVYPFEPNPNARKLLQENVQLNHLDARVNWSYADCAAGQNRAFVSLGDEPLDNLGATKVRQLEPQESIAQLETVVCMPLDEVQVPYRVSLVKIDVEGWELRVLDGAGEFLKKNRPALSVEVGWWNDKAFWMWLDECGYHVVALFQDTEGVKNYVAIPRPL